MISFERMRKLGFKRALWPRRLDGDLGAAFIRTLIARAVAALGALALALVIGRIHGTQGMGVYALAYGLLLGMGMLARFGMDNALMRYIGQDNASSHVLTYLRWAIRRTVYLSLLLAALLLVLRHWLEGLFGAPGVAAVLVGIAIAGPAYTMGYLLSGFFKAIGKPATACLLENGSVAMLAGIIIAFDAFWLGRSQIETLGYAYAAAAWLVALQGSLQAWRWCRRQRWWRVREAKECVDYSDAVSEKQFMFTARAFFASGFANFMQTVLGVLIAGTLLSSGELGLFKSAQQATVLIGFVLIVINAIFPPRFAALHHSGQDNELEHLAKKGVLLGLVFAMPLFLICVVAPAWVMGFFGESFQEGANLLRIIAFAQLVNVATGSVGFLLSMTGHELLMRNIALISNGLGLIGFIILPSVYGAMGAAMALSFVLIVQNMVAMYFVRRRLGIWTVPGLGTANI